MLEIDIDDKDMRVALAKEYPVWVVTPCQIQSNGYICTRERDHIGSHVAHGWADEVCAVWGKENDPS